MLNRLIMVLAIAIFVASIAARLDQPTLTASLILPSSGANQPTTTPAAFDRKLFGFSINLHHTEKPSLYDESIDQLESLGVNSLQIVTPAFQQDGASNTISIPVGEGRCPPREDLVRLLTAAKSKGMFTVLMPIVLFTEPRGNEWRGRLNPTDWDQWWASYRQMIFYFVDIANEADVDMLCIGSELLTTEQHADRWLAIVREIRDQYPGLLSYSTNWDHFHVPTFWHAVDAIGVSGYWNLTKDAANNTPTDAELATRWAGIKKQLLDFADEKQLPIYISELGYPTLPWALKDPWNYIPKKTKETGADPFMRVHDNQAAQARGYQSFLNAFTDDLTDPNGRMQGVLFYKWDPYYAGSVNDTGYGVRGKPAFDVVKNWLDTNRATLQTSR